MDSSAKKDFHYLGPLLVDKEFCDFNVRCEGSVFPCHQVVLAAKSPVFKALLQAEMKEKITKTIVIKDSNPETIFILLHFIYTADVKLKNMTFLMARHLLGVAEKYLIEDLKKVCEEKLCMELEVNNSIECLVLADMHRASKLKKMALELVAKNKKMIRYTDVYKDLLRQRPDLVQEINRVKIQ